MRRERATFGLLDAVLLAAIALGGFLVVRRLFGGIDYDWNWSVIGRYLIRHDPERGWVPNLLLTGFFTTIRLSLWAAAWAIPIGVAVGLCRTSRRLFPRMVGASYVGCVRNLPPLVLVFICYFFLADRILPVMGIQEAIRHWPPVVRHILAVAVAPPERVSGFFAGVFTLALYEGAYIGEIVRAGIQSVERGQWEAGHALGLTWWQQMRWVIGPQAVQRTVPPLAGQFISTIKDSAIVSVISIQELTFQGLQLMAATYLTFEVWITVTAMYLVLTLSCSMAARRLEAVMGRGR